MPVQEVITYTDGGARGNPGPAGIGVVIYDAKTKTEIAHVSRYLGETTNNVAEYTALLAALEKAKELGARVVHCRLDSELVVKQMNGQYKVRQPHLQTLFVKIHNIRQSFAKVSFEHVRREYNKVADRLANEAMDRKHNKCIPLKEQTQ